jgi:2-iminobutanoate/2-iminopropanoate deaminase
MLKEIIHTQNAPKPGFYSQAVKYGNLIFVSGQTSEDPVTNQPVHDSVGEQTSRILNNIKSILEAVGSNLEKVLRVDVFLSSMAHKTEFDKVYQTFFPINRPARNCVEVAGIDDDLDVEIEVIAGTD